MYRTIFAGVLVVALTIGLACSPADAALLVLKDGRQLSGQLKVDGNGVTLTTADGKSETVPYGLIQGISLDDQPLEPAAHDLGHSTMLNNDWLVWTAVGANVATMVLALIAIYRASQPVPATAP